MSFNKTLELSGNGILHSDLYVDHDISLGNHLEVHGDVSFNKTLELSGNGILHSDLYVDNDISLGNHLEVHGDVFII